MQPSHGPGTPAPVDLLVELLQGYRHPAAVTDDQGVVVYMNPAAVNGIDEVDQKLREHPRLVPLVVSAPMAEVQVRDVDPRRFDRRRLARPMLAWTRIELPR